MNRQLRPSSAIVLGFIAALMVTGAPSPASPASVQASGNPSVSSQPTVGKLGPDLSSAADPTPCQARCAKILAAALSHCAKLPPGEQMSCREAAIAEFRRCLQRCLKQELARLEGHGPAVIELEGLRQAGPWKL